MTRPLKLVLPLSLALVTSALAACEDSSTSSAGPVTQRSDSGFVADSSPPPSDAGITDAPVATDAADATAPKVLPAGMIDPVAYLSRADSPFTGIAFASYSHFEDWEDNELNTPGVTADSDTLSSSFGPALIDSVDGDDLTVDGKCAKSVGTCNAAFGNGSITFTFDADALGALPTHVGIAWTDGATGCDAIFEAYDDAGALIGTRTAAGIGNADNTGATDEDRFFGVVHPAGVKKIVVKSSAGGVEVDHLTYGR